LVIETLDSELDPDPYLDPQLGKMLDPDKNKINADPQPCLQKVRTWLVGLAEVSGSAVLTPVSHIVGAAAAHLLSWIRGTEQPVAGQSKANQRTQLSPVCRG
jgi:hypothetical protein